MIKYSAKYSLVSEIGAPMAAAGALIWGPSDLWWLTLAAFFVMCGLGMHVGFHKLLTHGSFECSDRWKLILIYLGAICNSSSGLIWVAWHRIHHQYADTSKDPSFKRPFIRIMVNENFDGMKYIKQSTVKAMRDPLLMWTHKWHVSIIAMHVVSVMIVGYIIDQPWLVIYGWLIPSGMVSWAFTLHARYAHMRVPFISYRNHDTNDESSNSPIWAILCPGEGNHNNHHAHPNRWNNAEKWWEYITEWPSLFIRMIKRD